MLMPLGLNQLRLPFRHWGSINLQELSTANQRTLSFNLGDPPFRYIVVVLVKPASLDTQIVRHLVQILYRVWEANQMPSTIGQIFHRTLYW